MPWSPEPGYRKRRSSIKLAVEAILELGLDDKTEKALLNCCLWQWTEVHGKFNTRFITRGALDAPDAPRQHEHVHTRKALIKALRAAHVSGRPVGRVLRRAIACTVTRDEHLRLNLATAKGWTRYRAARIEVVDQKTGLSRP